MSERLRKGIGTGLLILTAALLAAGFLPPEPKAEPKSFTGRNLPGISVSALPHLEEESPVNTGDAEALTALPGIGPSIAESLIRERDENGMFRYPEDLTAVKGIGEKKLEQIRPLLTADCGESEE